jgi:hypothetical protein
MEFTGGLPETRCGLGSTVRFTEQLRPQLENLFRFLGVTSIVDAPCGDFNWMSRVDLSQIKYTGIDRDRDNLLKATRLSEPEHFAPRVKVILELDLTFHVLPTADLILCRDFLQHLPKSDIRQVLFNFKRSGAKWVLITNHEQWVKNEDIERPGGFFPVNLMMEPFYFPPPVDRIVDGHRRTLSLWRRDQIP